MKEYHKIINIYERDTTTNRLIEGKFREPLAELLKDTVWTATEKIDGTNIRIHWDGKNVIFGGRTDNAMLPSGVVDYLNKKFITIEARSIFASKFGEKQVTLYGEGYGAGIQKGGGNYSKEKTFILFDVKIDETWLERGNVLGIGEMFSVDVVPVVMEGTLDEIVAWIKTMPNSTWGSFETEGVVARPKVECFNRFGERIILKIKCRDFN